MQLDDLKNTWEREIAMENKITEFSDIRRRVDEFDRRANLYWARDFLAWIVAIIAVLLVFFVRPPSWGLNLPMQLGAFLMVACGVFTAAKTISLRRVSTTDDWTLSSKINIQIEKREKEVRLLNTVTHWGLITPLIISVILVSYGGYMQRTGSYIPDLGLWIYWVLAVVVFIGCYFGYQNRIKKKIQPILDQLYVMKSELES
ncbi:MAG: hypothetical protein COA71_01985 [SAR86 cluster bacterium]|uniref:Uncharacterized protein n=1 Tax=SAR86 cluster bacterium TaxID=2030880 RepID=A0A2A5CIF7_9GAMM|nr:MAG: hypothetical protein COA71_01985 [SAR86 cluster bacterium]